MDIGLNVAALPWDGEFDALPELLDLVGADIVELPVQLWQARAGGRALDPNIRIASVSGLLRKTDVLPESLLAPDGVWEGEAALIPSRFAAAQTLGAVAISLSIDPWSDRPARESKQLFLERLAHCADLAVEAGLCVHLEYVSPAVARASGDRREFPFCPSLDAARGLIDAVERPWVKLLLDVLHWSADTNAVDPALLVSEVGLVHLTDHEGSSPERLSDAGRRVPFEGRLEVRDFVSSLVRGGYTGPALLEVFHDPRMGPSVEQIKASLASLRSIGLGDA